jgi:hypothetical protein
MSRDIKESDWKLFRKMHQIALERFCRRILVEIERINSAGTLSCHQRYLDIFGLIQRRNEEMAQAFDDPRRSTALIQLAVIQSHDLLTEEELSRFSPETRDTVEFLLGLRRQG